MATTTPVLPHNLADFVELTLKQYHVDGWEDVSLDLTRYFAMDRMFTGRRRKLGGGSEIAWKIQTDNTDTARPTELFDTDSTEVKDIADGGDQIG